MCTERVSARTASTKLVHQKYLPRSSAKVSVFYTVSFLKGSTIPQMVHESGQVPRMSWASYEVSRIGFCKTLSVLYPSVCPRIWQLSEQPEDTKFSHTLTGRFLLPSQRRCILLPPHTRHYVAQRAVPTYRHASVYLHMTCSHTYTHTYMFDFFCSI